MAIKNAEEGISEVLQNALGVAISELVSVDDDLVIAQILEHINELRNNMMISSFNDRVIINQIWSGIRSKQDVLGALLSTTTTFTLEIENIDIAIEYLTRRLVPFTPDSAMVDRELLGKAANVDELYGT
ncbi:hypothetical protein, partial [Pseudomonas aeruginosa]|uniref:hypothetical protein n=1 Tax=Pseudomonas aeruginosa TaxID=287 RepID=UPI001CA4B6AE